VLLLLLLRGYQPPCHASLLAGGQSQEQQGQVSFI
jgi:hypothetical protein